MNVVARSTRTVALLGVFSLAFAFIVAISPPAFAATAQTINPPTPPSGPWNTSLSVLATATSGLTVTYTIDGVDSSATGCAVDGAGNVTASTPGTCEVFLDQAGDATYDAAPEISVTATFTTAGQTITPPAPPSGPWNTNLSVMTTASSGLT